MSTTYLRKIPAYILGAMLLVPCASAQEVNAVPASVTIPNGTPIKPQLAESVSSAHACPKDRLDFIVTRDVQVEGFTVIPAGTVTSGSVTGAKGKRLLGIVHSFSLPEHHQ